MLSPEQIALQKRIDSIFSPYAVGQMEGYFKEQNNQTHLRFVYYTPAEGALRIIETKRVWMRNVTCMSDFSEVRHGHGILRKFFQEPANRQAFNEVLEKCAPGAAEEAFKIFDSWWNDISLNTYITSISEHDDKEDLHGRLSMWRAFGGNTARVAIVFKVPLSLLSAGVLNLVFSPVAYLTETEIVKQFHTVAANIGANWDFLKSIGHQRTVTSIFNMLVAGVTCLKHEGFKEEREWRLIYSPKRWPSPLIDSSTEVVGGIPQVVYRIPLDRAVSEALDPFDLANIFDRLIIGPSQYPWSMPEAFTTVLKGAGVAEPEKKIFLSGIPIRL